MKKIVRENQLGYDLCNEVTSILRPFLRSKEVGLAFSQMK